MRNIYTDRLYIKLLSALEISSLIFKGSLKQCDSLFTLLVDQGPIGTTNLQTFSGPVYFTALVYC